MSYADYWNQALRPPTSLMGNQGLHQSLLGQTNHATPQGLQDIMKARDAMRESRPPMAGGMDPFQEWLRNQPRQQMGIGDYGPGWFQRQKQWIEAMRKKWMEETGQQPPQRPIMSPGLPGIPGYGIQTKKRNRQEPGPDGPNSIPRRIAGDLSPGGSRFKLF